MSPVPDILQVAREAAREDEDGVDPHIIAVAQEARRQRFRGGGDAAEAIVVERQGDVGFGGARLYLDEGDNAATPRPQLRSEGRRGGNECVRTGRRRGSP